MAVSADAEADSEDVEAASADAEVDLAAVEAAAGDVEVDVGAAVSEVIECFFLMFWWRIKTLTTRKLIEGLCICVFSALQSSSGRRRQRRRRRLRRQTPGEEDQV